jgi:hypothetical protein
LFGMSGKLIGEEHKVKKSRGLSLIKHNRLRNEIARRLPSIFLTNHSRPREL